MKTAIISPSGNLYGSEQVLIDYLVQSKNIYTVYVPKSSVLESELHQLNTYHTIRSFNSKTIHWFYFKLFVLISFSFIPKVYWNEAGHIRYAKLLANIFKNKTFYVHIRIIEDTKIERLGKIPDNLKLLTISDFMYDLISPNYDVTRIYDPYIFKVFDSKIKLTKEHNRVGIVGRITKTKGLNYINEFFAHLENEKHLGYEFHFFGDLVNDDEEVEKLKVIASRKSIKIIFHGFTTNINSIYADINILLHLSTQEALGRIIFEAISYSKPFIVFDKGGSGEIAKKISLDDFIIMIRNDNDWITDLDLLIKKIKNDYQNYVDKVNLSQKTASDIYSIEKYTMFMDKILG